MKLFMKLKNSVFFLFIFSVGIQGLYALDSAVIKEVKESGKIYHRLDKENSSRYLLPETEFSELTDNHAFGEYSDKVGYAAEALYYVKKSVLVENSSRADKENVDTSIEAVSKIVRSISKMKGMEYYSNTRKRWDILYKESYRIENPDLKEPVPDLIEGSSDGKTLYAYQVEHTFGGGIYKIQYNENSKMVVMKMENLSALSYGIIKAVEPGKLRIAINIIDDGDGYFVYIGICADTIKLSVFEKKMNKSFQSRLDAIFKWITLQF